MEAEKVLFLDIDGVLITERSLLAFGNTGKICKPDPVAIALLRRLTSEGVKLVISSSWRHDGKEAKDDLQKVLGNLMDHVHDEWATPYFGDKAKRGNEIADWLQRHPEVRDYAILDDESDMLAPQRSHFYKSNPREGISAKTMQRLIDWAKQPAIPPVPMQKIDGNGMSRSSEKTGSHGSLSLEKADSHSERK